MSVRSDFSPKSKYYLPKHRFLELYHYCLQYKDWKAALRSLDGMRGMNYDFVQSRGSGYNDPVFYLALKRLDLEKKIQGVEETALDTDEDIARFILSGVTDENATFDNLSLLHDLPYSRNTYYDRRRKFYSLLDQRLTASALYS